MWYCCVLYIHCTLSAMTKIKLFNYCHHWTQMDEIRCIGSSVRGTLMFMDGEHVVLSVHLSSNGLNFTMVAKVSWLCWMVPWTSKCADVPYNIVSYPVQEPPSISEPPKISCRTMVSHELSIPKSRYEPHKIPLGLAGGSYLWHE